MEPITISGIDCTADAVACLISAYHAGGWWLVGSLSASLLLAAWQSARGEALMMRAWPRAAWSALPLAARWGVAVALSLAASVLAGVGAGQPWLAALLAGIPAAAMAAGADRLARSTARVVRGDALPSSMRERASIRTSLGPRGPGASSQS